MIDFPDGDEIEEERTSETDFDLALSECGVQRDGFCSYAGSEYCDWDCPLRGHFDSDEEFSNWRFGEGEYSPEENEDDDES